MIERWLTSCCSKSRTRNDVVIRFTLPHTKTKEGRGRKYIMTPHTPPILNGPATLLTMAIEDGVLEGHPTLAQIYRQLAIKPDAGVI